MQLFRYCIAALFVLFAVIQFNDPDPLAWVVAYGLVAATLLAPSRHRHAGKLFWLTAGVLLILALEALPGFIEWMRTGTPASIAAEMSPDMPYVEPAREFLGVVIAAAAQFLLQRKAAK